MRITITFEMDTKTANLFLLSSIERVINTSLRIVEKSSKEDAYINSEDWEEWKPVVVGMWNGMHDKIFRVMSAIPDDNRVFTLRKGE